MSDILMDVQSTPATPASGQGVIFFDSTSKRLTTKNDTGLIDTLDDHGVASTANQTGFASDTYLAGSGILIPPGLVRAGTMYHLIFDMVKTAAGTATPTINIRFGTAGTTADTSRLLFTFTAGSAAADTGIFEVWCHWRSVGASSVLVGVAQVRHQLAATGLTTGGTGGSFTVPVVSSAFDSTVPNSIIGASFNGGASFSGTNVLQQAKAFNL